MSIGLFFHILFNFKDFYGHEQLKLSYNSLKDKKCKNHIFFVQPKCLFSTFIFHESTLESPDPHLRITV